MAEQINLQNINDIIAVFESFKDKVSSISEDSITLTYTKITDILYAYNGKKPNTKEGDPFYAGITEQLEAFNKKVEKVDFNKLSASLLGFKEGFDIMSDMFTSMDWGVLTDSSKKISEFILNISKMFADPDEKSGFKGVTNVLSQNPKDIVETFSKLPKMMLGIIEFSALGIIGLPLFKRFLLTLMDINSQCRFVIEESSSNTIKGHGKEDSSSSKKTYGSLLNGIGGVVEAYKGVLDMIVGDEKNGVIKKLLKMKLFGKVMLEYITTYVTPIIVEMLKTFKLFSESQEITMASGSKTIKKVDADALNAGIDGVNKIIDSFTKYINKLPIIYLILLSTPLEKLNSMIESTIVMFYTIQDVFDPKKLNTQQLFSNLVMFNKCLDMFTTVVDKIKSIGFTMLKNLSIKLLSNFIKNGLSQLIKNIVEVFDLSVYKGLAKSKTSLKILNNILDILKTAAVSIVLLGLLTVPAIISVGLIFLLMQAIKLLINIISGLSVKTLLKASIKFVLVGLIINNLIGIAIMFGLLTLVVQKLDPAFLIASLLVLGAAILIIVGSMWLLGSLLEKIGVVKISFELLLALGTFFLAAMIILAVTKIAAAFTAADLINVAIITGAILIITFCFGALVFAMNLVGGPAVMLLGAIAIVAILAIMPIAALLVVATAWILKLLPGTLSEDIENFTEGAIKLFTGLIPIGVVATVALPFMAPLLASSLMGVIAVGSITSMFKSMATFDMSVVEPAKKNITEIMKAWTEIMNTMVIGLKENSGMFTNNKRGGVLGLLGVSSKSSAEMMFDSIKASIRPVEMVLDLFNKIANGELSYLKDGDKVNIKTTLEAATDNVKLIMTEYGKMLNDLCENEVLVDLATSGTGLFGWGDSDAENLFESINSSVGPIISVLNLFKSISDDEWQYLKSEQLETEGFFNEKIKPNSVFAKAINNVDLILTQYGELLNRIASNEVLKEVATSGGFFGFGKTDGEKIFDLIGKSVSPITGILDAMNNLKDYDETKITNNMGLIDNLMSKYSETVKSVYKKDNWKGLDTETPDKVSKSVASTVESVAKLDVAKTDKFIEMMTSMKELNESFGENLGEFIEALSEKLVPALNDVVEAFGETNKSAGSFFGNADSKSAPSGTEAKQENKVDMSGVLAAIKNLTNEIASIKTQGLTVAPDRGFQDLLSR